MRSRRNQPARPRMPAAAARRREASRPCALRPPPRAGRGRRGRAARAAHPFPRWQAAGCPTARSGCTSTRGTKPRPTSFRRSTTCPTEVVPTTGFRPAQPARHRPASGGTSVGLAYVNGAGTFGCLVEDPAGRPLPPEQQSRHRRHQPGTDRLAHHPAGQVRRRRHAARRHRAPRRFRADRLRRREPSQCSDRRPHGPRDRRAGRADPRAVRRSPGPGRRRPARPEARPHDRPHPRHHRRRQLSTASSTTARSERPGSKTRSWWRARGAPSPRPGIPARSSSTRATIRSRCSSPGDDQRTLSNPIAPVLSALGMTVA